MMCQVLQPHNIESQQKYSLSTINRDGGTYSVDITHLEERKWKSVFYKHNEGSSRAIDAHKIASIPTTYSFCIKNEGQNNLSLIVYYETGLQLMQFEMLPDKTDSQNLERQLNWLQNQKNILEQQSEKLQGMSQVNRQLSKMMSQKLILFAVMGLFGVVLVNMLFYWRLKKTFKDRKLI